MVGDSISNEAGKNLGMETMLVLTGEGRKTLKIFVIKNPYHILQIIYTRV